MVTASDVMTAPPKASARAIWPLQWLNFFMADMQAGIGPFLGVFLLADGWKSGPIGSVMTIGGVAGMVMTAPAGALVDATTHKRRCVIFSGIFTVLASALILVSQRFGMVCASQIATAIAGAAIGPAVAGITLGIVRQQGFGHQNGRNQSFNHAGNMVGAGLSGWLGWKFGFTAVIGLAALFGVLSMVSVSLIPRDAIDHAAARGQKEGAEGQDGVSGLKVLLECKPLLILAGALTMFHLGNGAMLPLYGLAVVGAKQGNPALTVATATAVASPAEANAAMLKTIVKDWSVIGPFKNNGLDAPDGPETDYVQGKAKPDATYPGIDGTPVTWTKLPGDAIKELGVAYLNGICKPDYNVTAYAAVKINSPIDQKVTLLTASADVLSAWVNGTKVMDKVLGGAVDADDYRTQVSLNKGDNTVLLKVTEFTGHYPFAYRFRVGDPYGQPIDGLTYSPGL